MVYLFWWAVIDIRSGLSNSDLYPGSYDLIPLRVFLQTWFHLSYLIIAIVCTNYAVPIPKF